MFAGAGVSGLSGTAEACVLGELPSLLNSSIAGAEQWIMANLIMVYK